jgi:amidohydrolase
VAAPTVDARSLAAEVFADAVEWRRHLHRHPELSFQEEETSRFVAETLESFGGIEVTRPTETSVLGRLVCGAGGGPVLALRADIDALPIVEESGLPFASERSGVMHACGHDGHTAELLAVARILSGMRDGLRGEVRFVFQHAEELLPGGARDLVSTGVMEGVDFVVGCHLITILESGKVAVPVGPFMAAPDTFEIVVRGKGGHASAPHDCLDPIPIAAEIIQAFQTLVTRRVNVFDPAVLTIGKLEAGTTRNVIPETASLLGTVRTVSEKTRTRMLDGVRRVAEGVAAAHGAQATVEITRGYPVTVNDDAFAAFVLETATELLGPERVRDMPHPLMGSEDFSYVLQRIPGAMTFLGTRPDSGPAYPNHSNRMLVNESALSTGIALHAAVALRFLTNGGRLTA